MRWIKIKTALLLGLFLLVSLTSAGAVLEFVDANTTIEVDYGDFNDEDQLTLRKTMEFDVRNTNEQAGVVRFSFESLPAGYNATAPSEINLSVGETRRISTTIDIPHKQDVGRAGIGVLVLKDSNNAEQDRLSIAQNTKSMISIESIDIDYTDKDGKAQSDDFDGNDATISLEKSVRPGTEIRLAIEYKNLFDSDYDEDKAALEDLTLKLDFDSDLFSDDLDDEYDLDNLDANKREEFVIETTIAEDADVGDHTLEFRLQAADGEGFDHEQIIELTIDIERDRDDVRITQAAVQPSSISTCDREFIINTEVRNFGSNDQKYVALAIANSDLGINENVGDIQLDKFDDDDTYSQNFPIVLKKTPREGTYILTFKAFIDRDELVEEKRVNLIVTKCIEQEPVEPSEPASPSPRPPQNTSTPAPASGTGGTNTPPQPNASAGQPSPTQNVVQTIEEPYTNDDFLIAGLVIAIVVVIALIIIFFIVLLR